jgi:hypothetical protein
MTAVTGSALLYDDFATASSAQLVYFACGCVVTFLGVYLITTAPQSVTIHLNRSKIVMTGGLPPTPIDAPDLSDIDEQRTHFM